MPCMYIFVLVWLRKEHQLWVKNKDVGKAYREVGGGGGALVLLGLIPLSYQDLQAYFLAMKGELPFHFGRVKFIVS